MRCVRARSGAGLAFATALCFLIACGEVQRRDDDSGSGSDPSDDDGDEGDGDAPDAGDEADGGGEEDAGTDAGGELTIVNNSGFFIEEVFVAELGSDYGPNLAPVGGLPPNDEITFALECSIYDVLFIDEKGVECEVFDVSVCGLEGAVVFEDNDCFVEK